MALSREHIQAYLDRPWGLLERIRDVTWGNEVRTRGPARAVTLSWHLREQLRQQHPGWPSEEDRRQDLADHVRLKETLDRASLAIGARNDGP